MFWCDNSPWSRDSELIWLSQCWLEVVTCSFHWNRDSERILKGLVKSKCYLESPITGALAVCHFVARSYHLATPLD